MMHCDICKGENGCGRCKNAEAKDEKRQEYIKTHCPLKRGEVQKCQSCKPCAVVSAPKEQSKV
jgi:hypothetical protein